MPGPTGMPVAACQSGALRSAACPAARTRAASEEERAVLQAMLLPEGLDDAPHRHRVTLPAAQHRHGTAGGWAWVRHGTRMPPGAARHGALHGMAASCAARTAHLQQRDPEPTPRSALLRASRA